ncbi:MAG TPA: protein kinase [Streptosporangiaceae bacterium]|nr:protein kinase [Streptosporangiaceae bacterium]
MSAHSGDERLGPYRLRERLGEGGMGVVYLALDADDSPVAVKVLRQGVPAEATARHRLGREVETMRRIHSPFVAEVVDADVEGDPPYIVTRYVAGRTLEDIVTADGPLTGAALARLARGLAAALTSVHAAGVVHRDLKPGNVMLLDGEPVVIDFGIAQALDATRLTMTGMFMGTPGYLAPEVIEGKPSGPAADVHSWAATMAYAATGRPPFGTGQFEAIFYRIVHGQPELDCMPAPLLPVVLACLAREPGQRPCASNLAEMVAALNPETLVPAPPGAAQRAISAAAAVAGLSGAATRTALDVASPALAESLHAAELQTPAWPGTRPIALQPKDDYADLLTPVRYPQDPGPPRGVPAGMAPGSLPPGSAPPGAVGPGSAPVGSSARGQAVPGQAGPARWLLVLATLAALVAVSVLLPIAGAALALAVLVLLRATDATSRWMGRRRSRQGPRRSDPVSATAFFPLAVGRSVLSSVLLAPMALLCAAIAAVLAVLATGPAQLPKVGSYAAGALVACYCIGPGSRACRRPLSSFYGKVTSSVPTAIIGSLGIAALAVGVIVAAATLAPGYWPDAHLGDQLQNATVTHPGVNHLPTDIGNVGRYLARVLRHNVF